MLARSSNHSRRRRARRPARAAATLLAWRRA
jgi:hypothetical protein